MYCEYRTEITDEEDDVIVVYNDNGQCIGRYFIYIDPMRINDKGVNIVLFYLDGNRWDIHAPTVIEYMVNRWEPHNIRAEQI